MVKKIMLGLAVACLCASYVHGQDPEDGEKSGEDVKFSDGLFTGGSVTVSFFNQQTILGATPMFGHTLTSWADAGVVFNFMYSGARDYQFYDDKIRQTIMGPGVFTRVYPIPIIFVQAQFEHNFIKQKYIYPGGSPTETYKEDVSSLLVGAGLAQGRFKGGTTFYYISLLFDVLKNENSPYTRVSINPNDPTQQRVDMVPVIRAGFNIGLGRKNR
jgi:hypothetical protein